jgi:hypothetical protein
MTTHGPQFSNFWGIREGISLYYELVVLQYLTPATMISRKSSPGLKISELLMKTKVVDKIHHFWREMQKYTAYLT